MELEELYLFGEEKRLSDFRDIGDEEEACDGDGEGDDAVDEEEPMDR